MRHTSGAANGTRHHIQNKGSSARVAHGERCEGNEMRFRGALPCSAVAVLTTALLGEPASAGKTLDAVRARGAVKCGVNMGAVGFATADSTGAVKGFDADFCRTIAA